MKIKIFIMENGNTREWDRISEEEKKRISRELNIQGMKALGYVPVGRKDSDEAV